MNSIRGLLSPRRGHPLHVTVVAYLALFLALGGTSYAATRVAAPAKGHAATAHGKRGPRGPRGRRGPRGQQGVQGPKGDSGPSGNTTIASGPAWSQTPGGHLTAEGIKYYGEYEEFDQASGLDEGGTKAVRKSQLQTPLFSPNVLSGSEQHVKQIQFCYAIADAPGATFEPDVLSLDHLYVYEYNQPTATVPSGQAPQAPGSVTWLPGGKFTTTLGSAALSLPSKAGCTTVPVDSAAIDPDGYVVLDLEVAATGNVPANLFLGRLSYTLSPN